MRLQIVSDIHLEFSQEAEHMGVPYPDIPVKAPTLCLLGDIGYPSHESYRAFLLRQSERFQNVIVVAGNHEYYTSTIEEANDLIAAICEERPNLHFLNRSSLVIQDPDDMADTLVLGVVLWADIPPRDQKNIQRMINDYRQIGVSNGDGTFRPLRVTDTVARHRADVAFLQENIDAARARNQRVVVLSHHAPTKRNAIYPPDRGSEIEVMCYTDLEHMMGSPVALWAYGHTHWTSDQLVNGTRVCSNPVGYVVDPTNKAVYEPEWVIDLNNDSPEAVKAARLGIYEATADESAAVAMDSGSDSGHRCELC